MLGAIKSHFQEAFTQDGGTSMVVFNKQFATVRNNKLLHQEGILTIESPDCGLCGWPKVALCLTAQMVSLFIPSFNIVLFSQHHREGSIFIFLGAEREGEGSYDLCFSWILQYVKQVGKGLALGWNSLRVHREGMAHASREQCDSIECSSWSGKAAHLVCRSVRHRPGIPTCAEKRGPTCIWIFLIWPIQFTDSN